MLQIFFISSFISLSFNNEEILVFAKPPLRKSKFENKSQPGAKT